MSKALLVGMSLALVLAACAGVSDQDAGRPDVPIPDDLALPVELAIADLGSRLGANTTIEVVLVEDVLWPDGSLGCPQPGMAYTQAVVEGYRISLTDGDAAYAYNGAVGRDPFLCQNAEEPATTDTGEAAPQSTLPPTVTDEGSGAGVDEQPPTTEPSAGKPADVYEGPMAGLVALAVADLARQRSVSVGDIVVVSVESVVWPNGSLGCPIPGMVYAQVQVDGAKIVLSVDGGIYNYHSGGNRDPFLCVPTKAAPETGTTGLTLPGTDLDE